MLRQGMEMILAEFRRTFENLGVEEMAPVGQPFDPNLHEAIAQEPSEEIPEGHVLRQWKAGFHIGDRLLRPAAVVVSAGPANQKTASATNDN
jgi:molecular chaperone GrpE